jgi:hypothetical protein
VPGRASYEIDLQGQRYAWRIRRKRPLTCDDAPYTPVRACQIAVTWDDGTFMQVTGLQAQNSVTYVTLLRRWSGRVNRTKCEWANGRTGNKSNTAGSGMHVCAYDYKERAALVGVSGRIRRHPYTPKTRQDGLSRAPMGRLVWHHYGT